MTMVLEAGEWSAAHPGRTLPPGKTGYPLYRRLGGPQGRYGQVRKISPPPEFYPRSVQTVVSRYTDWATRLTYLVELMANSHLSSVNIRFLFLSFHFFSPSRFKIKVHALRVANLIRLHYEGAVSLKQNQEIFYQVAPRFTPKTLN
jgi:hypothetical protein